MLYYLVFLLMYSSLCVLAAVVDVVVGVASGDTLVTVTILSVSAMS